MNQQLKILGIEIEEQFAVYYHLKARAKIARPKSLEQSEKRREDFKKTF